VVDSVVKKASLGIRALNAVMKLYLYKNKASLLDPRKTGATLDSVMVIPALFFSIWHFVELSSQPEGVVRSQSIIGETSNLAVCMSKVAYYSAVSANALAIPVYAGALMCSAGLQIAEGAVEG
jgi:hypothetical protein